MTKTKPQGIARVIESIDTKALNVAVNVYDAIHEILTLSSQNIPTKKRGVGVRVDGRKGREKQ